MWTVYVSQECLATFSDMECIHVKSGVCLRLFPIKKKYFSNMVCARVSQEWRTFEVKNDTTACISGREAGSVVHIQLMRRTTSCCEIWLWWANHRAYVLFWSPHIAFCISFAHLDPHLWMHIRTHILETHAHACTYTHIHTYACIGSLISIHPDSCSPTRTGITGGNWGRPSDIATNLNTVGGDVLPPYRLL